MGDTKLTGGSTSRPTLFPLAIAALILVAAGAFGTVHPAVFLVIGSIAGVVGVAGMGPPMGPTARTLTGLCAVGLVLISCSLIPIGPDLRTSLQPGLAAVVQANLALVDQRAFPLAIRPGAAIRSLGFAVELVILAAGTAAWTRSERRATAITTALFSVGVVVSSIGLLQRALGAQSILFFTGMPATVDPRRLFFATFINPNHAAIFLAALLPLGLPLLGRLHLAARAPAAVGTGLVTLAILATGSRGVWLLVLASTCVLILLAPESRRARITAAVLLLVTTVLAGLVSADALEQFVRSAGPRFESELLSGRGRIYSDTWTLVSTNPWVGTGLAGYEQAIEIVRTYPWFERLGHAHNDYLEALAEVGVPAAALWFIALAGAALTPVRAALRVDTGRLVHAALAASLVAFGLGATYSFPMHIGAIAMTLAVVAGTAVGLADPRRDTSSKARGRVIAVPVLALSVGAHLVASRAPQADDPRAAVLAEPLDQGALLQWARQAARHGDQELLENLTAAAVRTGPNDSRSWLLEAYQATREGTDRDRITRAYQKLWALEQPPGVELDTIVRRGLDWASADELTTPQLLENYPRLCNIADSLLRMGQPAVAAEFQDLSARGWPACHYNRALRFLASGEPGKALTALQQAPPTCHRALQSARAWMQLEDSDRAFQWLYEAQDLCGSDDIRVRSLLAQLRWKRGDARSLEIMTALLEDDPDNAEIRRLLVAYFLERGRRDQALPLLEWLVDHGKATTQDVERYLDLSTGF